jgi:formylmethanofuran dehydrogenase subunit E
MMDSNLDLRIPPVIRCRTCGERVEIIYTRDGICKACYYELADEYPEEVEEDADGLPTT